MKFLKFLFLMLGMATFNLDAGNALCKHAICKQAHQVALLARETRMANLPAMPWAREMAKRSFIKAFKLNKNIIFGTAKFLSYVFQDQPKDSGGSVTSWLVVLGLGPCALYNLGYICALLNPALLGTPAIPNFVAHMIVGFICDKLNLFEDMECILEKQEEKIRAATLLLQSAEAVFSQTRALLASQIDANAQRILIASAEEDKQTEVSFAEAKVRAQGLQYLLGSIKKNCAELLPSFAPTEFMYADIGKRVNQVDALLQELAAFRLRLEAPVAAGTIASIA